MKKQFEAIEKVVDSLAGLSLVQVRNVLEFAHREIESKVLPLGVPAAANIGAIQTEMDTTIPEKKAPKSKAKGKAKKTKDPIVVPTKEEIMGLCKEVATKLKSADKVKELIRLCCKVDSLGEVTDETCFIDLKKKLQDV